MDINRIGPWDAKLSEYIASVRDKGFEWGKHDCCIFCADAVLAITGTDAMGEFRGKYTTELGALKALKKYGKGDLEKTLDSKFERVPVGRAQRGDLAFLSDDSMGSIGICMGGFAWFVSDDGLERIPLTAWDFCWGVGHG